MPNPPKRRRPAKEFELFVPLRYNDGTPVEEEKIERVKKTLKDQFGGLIYFPQSIEGTWKVGSVTFRDELVILRVLADAEGRPRKFFLRLKEQLKEDLRQEEVLVLERKVRVL